MNHKQISKAQVKHIAKLANLTLNPQELKDYQRKLAVIIDYFAAIEDVDVRKIKATKTTVPTTNVYRKDQVQKPLTQKQALSNAKQTHRGYFVLKSIFK